MADVYVAGVRFPTGMSEVDLPEGIVIPNPKAWGEPVVVEAAPVPDANDGVERVDTGNGAEDRVEAPPMTGKGSGVKAWAEFAAEVGVEVDKNATKDEIIQALLDNGIIEAE